MKKIKFLTGLTGLSSFPISLGWWPCEALTEQVDPLRVYSRVLTRQYGRRDIALSFFPQSKP